MQEPSMPRTIRWTALVMALSLGLVRAADEPDTIRKGEAKDPTPKAEKKTEDLVMHFHNGTSIRLVPLDQQLEIVTKYGRLQVPTSDIRRIEFGLHMPDDMAKKVDALMKDLESVDFQTREAAGKRLVSLGRYAYPTLVKASKGSNLETTRRVQELVKELRKKFPAYQLKIRTEDTIYTGDFAIVGNLSAPALRVKSEHFGEATVKLSDLRSAAISTGGEEIEVVVDASKYGINNQWLETEFSVEADVRLKITASGMVDIFPQGGGQYVCGPDGSDQLGQRGAHMPGQLLGRIGESGQVFLIGANYDGTPKQEGKLYLHIWPFRQGPTGSFTVKIRSGD
jgi:hypothetical protein